MLNYDGNVHYGRHLRIHDGTDRYTSRRLPAAYMDNFRKLCTHTYVLINCTQAHVHACLSFRIILETYCSSFLNELFRTDCKLRQSVGACALVAFTHADNEVLTRPKINFCAYLSRILLQKGYNSVVDADLLCQCRLLYKLHKLTRNVCTRQKVYVFQTIYPSRCHLKVKISRCSIYIYTY